MKNSDKPKALVHSVKFFALIPQNRRVLSNFTVKILLKVKNRASGSSYLCQTKDDNYYC